MANELIDFDHSSEVSFVGFELAECVIHLEPTAAKYLRAVHRTALELAIPNRFGIEAGGFWLTNDQIAELRKLPDHYPPSEAPIVAETIETYLEAQLRDFYSRLCAH
ncbi:MAG: hypothetical protein ACJ8LM_16470 [Candidatus Udaeobacter sp.]